MPGFRPWCATRTIHRAADDADWRECQNRWRVALVRAGWAEVWRVELQRRKVPHVHSVIWVPEDVEDDAIRTLWLRCVREEDDLAAVDNAMMLRPESITSSAWVAYVAGHSGKSKAAQLGWNGKQWGVINKGLFRTTPSYDVDLEPMAARWFARLVRRWFWARYRVKVFASEKGFTRAMDGSAFPALIRAALALGKSRTP